MKRTTEKVLAIIGAVFTALSIISSLIFYGFIKAVSQDGLLRQEMEMDLLSDEAFTVEDVDMIMWFIDSLAGFGLFIIIILVISLIATVIGIVYIWNDKNRKLAGSMFIVGGLFAFGLSITSILLYIAGIFCFTKKAPYVEESIYIEDGSADGNGDKMKPL